MYEEHQVFKSPPDDTVLWRYMDFTKFVSLLDKGALFFARADKLGDPFEGSYSRMNEILRPVIYADRLPEGAELELGQNLKKLRKSMLINCWHESLHESAAMWRLYSREKDGIVIKTSFGSFKKSLTTSEIINIGRVSYVDYESEFIPESNAFYPYLRKRKNFEHEREVRAIAWVTSAGDGRIDSSEDICDIGKYYGVDLSLLIQEVIVAPYAPEWFVELINSVAARYNIDAPVARSALADNPTWG